MIGEITEKSKYFKNDNYLDITDGIVFNKSSFPELYSTTRSSDLGQAVLKQHIENPAPVANDYFGDITDIYEDTLVVGAYGDDDDGMVHVYINDNGIWTLQQTISNPNPVFNDNFGKALSLYGDTLAVGTPLSDIGGGSAGQVYVFTRTGTTWSLEQQIAAPQVSGSDEFGEILDLYRDTLVIGVSKGEGTLQSEGEVVIFTRLGTTWTEEQTIAAPISQASGGFGYSVSIYEDTLVAGATGLDNGGLSAVGKIFVFSRTGGTWTLNQTITHPGNIEWDSFGGGCSIWKDKFVADSAGGKVYAFSNINGTWTLIQSIGAEDGNFDWTRLSIRGDDLVIGDRSADFGANGTGSIYLYRFNGSQWILKNRIDNPDPDVSDQFGSTSFYGDIIVSGSGWESTTASKSGKTYIYEIPRFDFSLSEFNSTIYSPDGINDNFFGNDTAVSGNTLVISSNGDANYGRVHIFIKNNGTWTHQQSIESPSTYFSDFGDSIAIEGDVLVISEKKFTGTASSEGRVFVYTRSGTTWTLHQTISNPTPLVNDTFGSDVDIYQETIVIGVAGLDGAGAGRGAVYVYDKGVTDWANTTILYQPTPVDNDLLGSRVQIFGDVIVGAAGGKIAGASQWSSGAAYIWHLETGTWTYKLELLNPSPLIYDWFARDMSLSGGNILAIGAGGDDDGQIGAGTAYVYRRIGTTWVLEQEINNPTGLSGESFGSSICVDGNTLVVGAYGVDFGGNDSEEYNGAMWVFNYNNGAWEQVAYHFNPETTNGVGDQFGYTPCAILDNEIFMPDNYNDVTKINGGAVQVFESPNFGASKIQSKITDNDTTKFFIQAK